MRSTNLTSLIYIGIKGTVLAVDRRTGAEQWRTPLKGSDFVNVVLDGDALFATARGELFCLDPTTGQVRWNNPLTGLGWGLLTIAGGSIVPMAQVHVAQQQAAASTAAMSGAVVAAGVAG